jgi:hypothetical protein
VWRVTRAELTPTLRWAVRLLVVEAIAVGLMAALIGYGGLTGVAAERSDALTVAGFVALVAVALAGLAAALHRRKPRARAPAIVLQLLLVMLGVVVLTGGAVWLGAPFVLLGVVVATLLFAPSSLPMDSEPKG